MFQLHFSYFSMESHTAAHLSSSKNSDQPQTNKKIKKPVSMDFATVCSDFNSISWCLVKAHKRVMRDLLVSSVNTKQMRSA